jgi:putative acetyltransferase
VNAAGPHGAAHPAVIRPECPGDEAALRALHAACFPSDAEAQLVDLLRAAGRLSVSLVAVVNGALAGHVALSPVTVAAATAVPGAGLAPLAVAAGWRRRGVGADLVRGSLAAARVAGFGWVVVLGEPSYYARFGFRPASGRGLQDEYGGGAAFQALELVAGAVPVGAGLVRYAPEFAAVG